MGDELNYNELGLKVGLEIHQQLDTRHKLFCSCPTKLAKDEEPKTTIIRYLRVAKSEVGEIDPAALYEMRKGRKIVYDAPYGHVCMVELDEEPPHDLNKEALTIGLAIAKALNSTPVDEVYVMRKIVIDGSNTTGFQRTAIIALGGYVKDIEGNVGIQTICIEEDAARKVDERPGYVRYNLDRLGIPLIEIATAPDIKSPDQAMRVAFTIGLLMRLTGKVKRGLGTIRQDLNISIKKGEKIEIKGVSKLELIPEIVRNEVLRQLRLLEIKSELLKRGVREEDVIDEVIDITHLLEGTESKLVKRALKKGLRAYAIRLKGFRGLLGKEVQPGRRFGTELSDYAKAWGGVQGIIHSDELPGYGITSDVKRRIYDELGLDESRDAFVFVLSTKEQADRALKAVADRARFALKGIPKETRGANPDGTTRYLRPQPGAARMYPETDVPPVKITQELMNEAGKLKPMTPEEMLEVLVRDHGLSRALAEQLIRDPSLTTYLDIVHLVKNVPPSLVASTLMIHIKGLKSEGLNVDLIDENIIIKVLEAVGQGRIAKEAIPEVLEKYVRYQGQRNITDILKEYSGLREEELRKIVKEIVESLSEQIIAKGERSFGLVMGRVMAKVRGKADGKLVATLVREEIKKLLSNQH